MGTTYNPAWGVDNGGRLCALGKRSGGHPSSPVVWRGRLKDQEFKAILHQIGDLRIAWAMRAFLSKMRKEKVRERDLLEVQHGWGGHGLGKPPS